MTDLQVSEEKDEYLWGSRWEIVHRVWLSSLYHGKRERFYDMLDKGSKAVAVIGGAAAVSQLLADPSAKIWIAALVSISSTLSLVFGFSQKASRHAELSKDFKRLWAQIEEAGAYPGEEALNKFKAKILSLETAEPTSLSALVKRCENQISVASGHPEEVHALTWPERLLMHFWDFDPKPANAS